MATATTVPVEITPEAAALIAEHGLEKDIQTMIEHTLQTVPDLHSVEVTRYDDPAEPIPPRIVLTAWRNKSAVDTHEVWKEWIAWYVRASPDEVSGDVYEYVGFDAFDRDNLADAKNAIGLLDQIEADPQRRNAAIKDIRAAFP